VHGYNQRWAYVTVASIVSKGFRRPERTEAQTAAMLEKFISELVRRLHRPDGSSLF
jgi:hypothetical protein